VEYYDHIGKLYWDQLTCFLISDEETADTPFIFGYLMEKWIRIIGDNLPHRFLTNRNIIHIRAANP
jgi:hypothetical protein